MIRRDRINLSSLAMEQKQFRRLKRRELVDIIYQLQNSEEELQKKVEQLEEQLQVRQIKIEQSGSLAEASLKLAGIFEAAQQAADIYLEQLQIRAETKKATQQNPQSTETEESTQTLPDTSHPQKKEYGCYAAKGKNRVKRHRRCSKRRPRMRKKSV